MRLYKAHTVALDQALAQSLSSTSKGAHLVVRSLRKKTSGALSRLHHVNTDRHGRHAMRDLFAVRASYRLLKRAFENSVKTIEYFSFFPE